MPASVDDVLQSCQRPVARRRWWGDRRGGGRRGHRRCAGEPPAPLEYPCWSSGSVGPGSVVPEECVGEEQELAHEGGDGEFLGLTGVDHGLVFSGHLRVEAGCDECWHVESLPEHGASAPDGRAATPGCGLAGHGGQTGEAGGLLAAQGTEFGHLDHQGDGGEGGDAGNARQDGRPSGEVVLRSEMVLDGGLDGRDVPLDLREFEAQQAPDEGGSGDREPVPGRRAVLDQGLARPVQFLHSVERAVPEPGRRWLQGDAEAGENGCVDTIGLGQHAGGFREAPRLAWIDLGDRQAVRGQCGFQQAVIGARRLVDEAGDGCLADPADQLGETAGGVRHATGGAVRQAVDVQMILGDIDPNGKLGHLFRVPCLSSGSGHPGIRSGLKEKTGRPISSPVLTDLHMPGPTPPPAVRGLSPLEVHLPPMDRDRHKTSILRPDGRR